MTRDWTFGKRIAAGFTTVVALSVVIGLIAVVALNSVVSSKDDVIDIDARLLIDAERLQAASGEKSAAARGYLLSEDQSLLDESNGARDTFLGTLATVRQLVRTDEGRRLVESIGELEADHQRRLDAVVTLRRSGAALDDVIAQFAEEVAPAKDALTAEIDKFVEQEESLLNKGRDDSSATADRAIVVMIIVTMIAVLVAAVLAVLVTRRLRRTIGSTVGEIQSSSAELQAAANQQAAGAREQATAMNEITTTITELLATSRQIAESAQQVAAMAGQTASAGRSGETTVATAQRSIADIRQQVDVIVGHMLDLGDKSQRIGAVLDIVSELAEQTNILAINSTIEAAGAGEAGKRFAVVADEIRKLADRVADSTKEIRGLIDVVRSAVNTTVMATEIGSKAVDAGSRQFSEVATSFGEIAGLVVTTTEAAREIELSTKQQSTAVEQVNVAVTSVAQATRETEASSTQTLQTASQLTTLSRGLQRMVQRQEAT